VGTPVPTSSGDIQGAWYVGCGQGCAGPTGTLTVASTCVEQAPSDPAACKSQVNKLGQLALTYTAGKPPASYGNNYEDDIYASRFSDPGVHDSPYTMAPYLGEPGL
jgi:hypothetical protein